MHDQEQRLWRTVAQYVNERPAAHGNQAPPQLVTADWSFATERQRMLDSVERAAGQALAQYDAESEADRFSLSIKVLDQGFDASRAKCWPYEALPNCCENVPNKRGASHLAIAWNLHRRKDQQGANVPASWGAFPSWAHRNGLAVASIG